MTPQDDPAAFLAARLDDDEAAVRAMESAEARDAVTGLWASNLGMETPLTRYLWHYQPERVLREVAAKRAILERHKGHWSWDTSASKGKLMPDSPLCHVCGTLRAVLAVYEDHPDYRADFQAEWPDFSGGFPDGWDRA